MPKYPRKTIQVDPHAHELMKKIMEALVTKGTQKTIDSGFFSEVDLAEFHEKPSLISLASLVIKKFVTIFNENFKTDIGGAE